MLILVIPSVCRVRWLKLYVRPSSKFPSFRSCTKGSQHLEVGFIWAIEECPLRLGTQLFGCNRSISGPLFDRTSNSIDVADANFLRCWIESLGRTFLLLQLECRYWLHIGPKFGAWNWLNNNCVQKYYVAHIIVPLLVAFGASRCNQTRTKLTSTSRSPYIDGCSLSNGSNKEVRWMEDKSTEIVQMWLQAIIFPVRDSLGMSVTSSKALNKATVNH